MSEPYVLFMVLFTLVSCCVVLKSWHEAKKNRCRGNDPLITELEIIIIILSLGTGLFLIADRLTGDFVIASSCYISCPLVIMVIILY